MESQNDPQDNPTAVSPAPHDVSHDDFADSHCDGGTNGRTLQEVMPEQSADASRSQRTLERAEADVTHRFGFRQLILLVPVLARTLRLGIFARRLGGSTG